MFLRKLELFKVSKIYAKRLSLLETFRSRCLMLLSNISSILSNILSENESKNIQNVLIKTYIRYPP